MGDKGNILLRFIGGMFPFFVCGGKLWWFLEGRIVLEVGEEGIMMGQCLSVNQGHFQSEIAGITYKIYISVKVYLKNRGVPSQKSPELPTEFIF